MHKILLLQVRQSYKSIHRGPQTESITKYTHTFILGHCCPILNSCNRSMDTARSSCNWLSAIAYRAVTNCSEISGTSWNQHNHNCDFILQTRRNHMVWNCTEHGEVGSWNETQRVMAIKLTIWHSRQWYYSMKRQKAALLAVLSPSGKFRTSGHAFVWSL